MTVYVVQDVPGRNIIAATEFGELEGVLPAGNQIVLSPQPTVRRMVRALRNYTDDDYLLLMGDPAAIGLATAIAAQHNRGKVNLLKWDRIHNKYYPVKVDILSRETE